MFNNQNTRPQAIFLQFSFYDQKLMDCHLKEKNSLLKHEYISWCFSFVLFMTLIISSLPSFDVKYLHTFVYLYSTHTGCLLSMLERNAFVDTSAILDCFKVYKQTQESNPIEIVNAQSSSIQCLSSYITYIVQSYIHCS